MKAKATPNNEKAKKIFNTRERKLEIEKKLVISKLDKAIAAFDEEIVAMVYERMKIMEIVRILEMKQLCLYEDSIFLADVLAEDKLNNEKLKKLTTEIDQFDHILSKIANEMIKIEDELKYISDSHKETLDKEFQSLIDQENKEEIKEHYNRFFKREFHKRGSMIHPDDFLNDDN